MSPRMTEGRGAPPLRRRDRQLDDVGAPGDEAGAAVAQVEVPKPPEPLVEAQRRDLFPGLLEPVRPLPQRAGVVRAEAGDALPGQAGPGDLVAQPLLGREHAAG